MKIEKQQHRTMISHLSFYLKCGATLFLLLVSVLVIACGPSNTTSTANLNSPQVTVTIRFNNNASSPPGVAPYLCGAWITNTTPGFSPGNKIPVYAHFVHNVDGNPVGVNGASAQATVQWADGYRDSNVTTTTSDGLAVFYFTIPNRPNMMNRNNLVTVSFTGPNGESCKVDNQPQPAAYFTFIMASPTPSPSPSPSATPDMEPTQEVNPPVVTPSIDFPLPIRTITNKRATPTPTPPFLPPQGPGG